MRLFIAIELAGEIRKTLSAAQERLRSRCQGVRWVKPDLMHVTLKFLGEVSEGDVELVSMGMDQSLSQVAPFGLTVGGCGCFPVSGAVRTVWAGVMPPTDALGACASNVEKQMAELGFKEEKRFTPHITIGRVRNDRSFGRTREAVERHDFEPVAQPVESVTLMSSVLSPTGPTYTPVHTLRLG